MMSFEPLLLIALATFATEDLTCIATGLLVAQGRVDFVPGTLACLLGIFSGDILLFLAGRFAGRPILRFVSKEKIDRGSRWLSERGMIVVFLSRFAPGLRLPTYVAAGLLKTKFWRFGAYFLAAAAVWTPLLVGATVLLGAQILRTALARAGTGTLVFAAILGIALALRKLVTLGFSYRTRRAFAGFLLRKVRWEFWPPWAAYIPLAPYLVYLACRHRSLTLFTAANPGMPSGGFVGESKSEILEHLSQADGAVAKFALIPGSVGSYAKTQQAAEFMERNDLSFPVVLKPDVGERGTGVAIVRSRGEMVEYLRSAKGDTIIQEYIAGLEFGVFYYRYPGESEGRIVSITEKRFPEVTGDGESSVEQLILRDPRAVCLATVYLKAGRRPAGDVPAVGERVRLVELGSHCRGAVFLDGMRLKTRALEQAIDAISKRHPGFFFGRFDIRTPSLEALRQGSGFKVIELNGVSAEATHIYDPAVSLLEAYRVMYTQWRIAFKIGAINRRGGAQPMTVADLLRLVSGRECSSTLNCGLNTWQSESRLPRR
jgi:membrane protein DedA with SNARE-associated domain